MNTMEFDEFMNYIREHIREHLTEEYRNADIRIDSATKNNSLILSGLFIHRGCSPLSPVIYLDSYYNDYMDGRALDDILPDIAHIILHESTPEGFDADSITNLDRCRDRIHKRLVGTENNKTYLDGLVHKPFLDLAVLYYLDIDFETVKGTINISHSVFNSYGISVDELDRIASANIQDRGYGIAAVDRLIRQYSSASDTPLFIDLASQNVKDRLGVFPLYAVTSSDRKFGAAAMLETELMDRVSEVIGGDFYIIPSSIHEIILVPISFISDLNSLFSMIREVNESAVAVDERLSNSLYKYDSDTHAVCLVMEGR